MRRRLEKLPVVALAAALLVACSAARSELATLTSRSGQETSPAQEKYMSDLPSYGPAPELTNTIWLNTDAPLRLADLRGKVVLIDMWTFG